MKSLMTSLLLLMFFNCSSHKKEYDLTMLYKEQKLSIDNREASLVTDGKLKGLKLSENDDEGLAWLKDITFSNGIIEIDLRGQDVFQKSFLGIAFHGVNDSTYEAIYFRPFNFHATDSIRKIHAVQYIYHPVFTWKKLREEQNGIYEKALANPPDPNGWFHARIVVSEENVNVFVNEDKVPSLTVKRIGNVKSGKVGLWVGDGSGGEFSNFRIDHK